MAVVGRISDTTLYLVIAGLFLLAVVCFLYAGWQVRKESRAFSYEPLKPEDEFDED